ncbi:hypothetical protein NM688_g3407 [Phlebia brevispora]|uniref:Uncharacterized protein n=1 Tax=Phlebia brevispora TaxID=194682 RepID=A0ACC1T609_9APHY|nr:hypothetical protein NM688_g3407 [Phlebia brevispora]
MDRGGGGGPPRKGSSLPRTLHGSLLQPDSHVVGSVFTEEPQAISEAEGGHPVNPEYATYSTHTARFLPVPSSSRDPPTFEEGSSRGTVGVQQRSVPVGSDRPYDDGRTVQYPSYLYQPSYRPHVGSTDPTLYASSQHTPHAPSHSGSTQIYSYAPPTQTRLPPVRALEQEAGISSGVPTSRYPTSPSGFADAGELGFARLLLTATLTRQVDSTDLSRAAVTHLHLAKQFVAERERQPGYTHVVLITTGSVASIKAPLIVAELLKHSNVKVEVVATKASLTFYNPADIVKAGSRVWQDADEWPTGYKIGDPILHIELRRWADVVLVAPCSANTLSKIAAGGCDNLATSLLRALAPTTPTYLFPAMNTFMYEHPLTNEHIRIVRDVIGYTVVGPIGKNLACGDVGLGAMTEWKDIVQIVVDKFGLSRKEAP